MARSSLDEVATEDRLSLTVSQLSRAIVFLGTVAAHHRMALRREPTLRRLIEDADRNLAAALDEIDRAREDVRLELAAGAKRRRAKHFRGMRNEPTDHRD